jgi:hypothetical protein
MSCVERRHRVSNNRRTVLKKAPGGSDEHTKEPNHESFALVGGVDAGDRRDALHKPLGDFLSPDEQWLSQSHVSKQRKAR